ncbi:hypothetical protein BSLG_010839 [Batrachochytrium salamandrivorans]|nr:hypothetical protein BSLG_010839 [Batrachochytrium salamandrivorans]
MEYYSTDDEHIPVWKFQLRDGSITQWLEVNVDANTGGIVSSQDLKKRLYLYGDRTTQQKVEDGFSRIVNPENTQSSPNGWTEGYKLTGNNVLTILEGGKTFEMATKSVFGGIFDPLLPPQTPKNIMAGAVNAFYVANMVHDVFYAYGFTEPAGNFKRITSKGWNRGGPMIHELTHGLSSRLTGGARTKLCMAETESRGLSEGYSDIIALIFMAKPEDTRNTNKVMGEYVKALEEYTNHYNLGEIWATMLEVYWNFVEKYGFSANLHDATQKKGNIMFLQILVGTLMIQPCKLTFDSARDAMLAADYAYYGGIHKHLIRQGFAKRGLGSIS